MAISSNYQEQGAQFLIQKIRILYKEQVKLKRNKS